MQQNIAIGQRISRLPVSNAWSDTRLLNITRSNNNYTASETSSANAAAMTLRGRASGRFYWEVEGTLLGGSPFDMAAGLRRADEAIGTAVNAGQTMVNRANATVFAGSSGATTGTGGTFVAGDRLMFALDMFAKKFWIGKNGTWFNSGDPAAGTGALFSGFGNGQWHPYVWTDNSGGNHVMTLYNGQVEDALGFTPPDGFERGIRF